MAEMPTATVRLEVLGRCATCRHWWAYRDTPGTGDCERASGTNGVATYAGATKAFAQDDDNFCANLVTEAEFGCVMWEGKDGDR